MEICHKRIQTSTIRKPDAERKNSFPEYIYVLNLFGIHFMKRDTEGLTNSIAQYKQALICKRIHHNNNILNVCHNCFLQSPRPTIIRNIVCN
uniref:Uncharacterized protein n=1 Tax=Kalanchoe fedtschenkoi TaxID=63787 RepID=A0A7N0US07_KALFE